MDSETIHIRLAKNKDKSFLSEKDSHISLKTLKESMNQNRVYVIEKNKQIIG